MENNWSKIIFKPKPALVDIKSNGIHLYTGQKFDESRFKLDKNGWTHEHCDECFKRLEENDIMYQRDEEIKCEKCYQKRAST